MTSDTYLLYLLSVRPSVRMDGETDKIAKSAVCVNNAVLTVDLKNSFFLLERYDTRYLYLIHSVRLSVRFSVRLSLGGRFQLPKVVTADFKNYFYVGRYLTRYLYLINCFCLSVRLSFRLPVRFSIRLS